MLEKKVQYLLCVCILLKLYNYADAVSVALVSYVSYAGYFFISDQVCNILDKRRFVDVIRHLLDDYAPMFFVFLVNLDFRLYCELAFAVLVAVVGASRHDCYSTCRKVG